MIEVETCIINSQSDNAFIRFFFDVIWKKLLKS